MSYETPEQTMMTFPAEYSDQEPVKLDYSQIDAPESLSDRTIPQQIRCSESEDFDWGMALFGVIAVPAVMFALSAWFLG